MTKAQKIFLIVVIFSVVCVLVGEKDVLAYHNTSRALSSLKDLVPTQDEIRTILLISPDTHLYQYDATAEFTEFCHIDCVKMVWSYSEPETITKLTLIMIRSSNSENALRSLRNLWQIYTAMGSQFYLDEELTEQNNSWSGIMRYTDIRKVQHIAARNQGSVTILVFYDYTIGTFVADVDSAFFLGVANELSKNQQQKLLNAELKP